MGGIHVKNMDAGGWSEGLRHSFCKAPPSPTGRFLKDLRGQWKPVQWTKHEDQTQIEIGEYTNLTKKTYCNSGNQYGIVRGFEPHEWDMNVNQHAGTTNRIGMAKGHGYVCVYTPGWKYQAPNTLVAPCTFAPRGPNIHGATRINIACALDPYWAIFFPRKTANTYLVFGEHGWICGVFATGVCAVWLCLPLP